MKKMIFCNLDLLKPNAQRNYLINASEAIKNVRIVLGKVQEILKDVSNTVVFFSREEDTLRDYKKNIGIENDRFIFLSRKNVEEAVKTYKEFNYFYVVVGGKDVDFQLAVNGQVLLVVPEWIEQEEKTKKYGIHVDNPEQMFRVIRVLNNQNCWFYSLTVDEKTTVHSLIDARFGYYARSEEEKCLVSGIQELLKQNTPRAQKYWRIMLYHFIAGITNSSEFNDIQLFGVIPSSNCEVNERLYELMTFARKTKGKRLPKNYREDVPIRLRNLLIRHKEKTQNHGGGRSQQERIDMGADEEFQTMHLNPDYKARMKKLSSEKNLKICIFDDYMTHGNSFNAVRNLLNFVGADKVVFVSIGTFVQNFQKWDYDIFGDVFTPNYTYKLRSKESLGNYTIMNEAKSEVDALYSIFYNE